jgi:hypothetical protein
VRLDIFFVVSYRVKKSYFGFLSGCCAWLAISLEYVNSLVPCVMRNIQIFLRRRGDRVMNRIIVILLQGCHDMNLSFIFHSTRPTVSWFHLYFCRICWMLAPYNKSCY